MACEARDPGQRGAGLRLGAPLDQLIQVDYSGGEQSLNLDTGSAAELSPLETMLGLMVGHDALDHNLPTLETARTQSAADMQAITDLHISSPAQLQLHM